MIMGTTIRGATSSMGKALRVMDENKNAKVNRKEWFKFVDNIDMSIDKNNNDQIEFDEMLSHACSKYPDNKVCDVVSCHPYYTTLGDDLCQEFGFTNAELFKRAHESNVGKGNYAPWYNEDDRGDLNRDGIIDKLEYGMFDAAYKHRSNPDNYGFNLGTCDWDVICGQDY